MSPDELKGLGQSWGGQHWQGPLAAAIGVNPLTVSRWAHGKFTIPESVADTVRRVCHDRADGIYKILGV